MKASIIDLKERKKKAPGRAVSTLPHPPVPDGKALATLAGGIAHQFNNALFGITGNLELLKLNAPDPSLDGYIQAMRDSVTRMVNLTDRLMAYAQQGKYKPTPIRLNDFVREKLAELLPERDLFTAIETDLPGDVPSIEADPGQMGLVLSALVTNAAEAVNGQGRIRVSVRETELPDPAGHVDPDPGPYVRLRVEDDGAGMSDEVRARVFEPFFTTKFYGRGLGLSAVFGIATNHGGTVHIDSEQGEGTRVDVYLPPREGNAQADRSSPAAPSSWSGTVLLVEDDPVVMEVTEAMLERLGFHVLKAATGREAVRIAQAFTGKIHLAILDVSLPDMDGKGIHLEMKASHPETRTILSSGHLSDLPSHDMSIPGVKDVLQKPFSLQSLESKISEVLSRNQIKMGP